MEGERRRHQVLHRQATESVYKEFTYFMREAEVGMPVHDVAKAQESSAKACDISTGSAQRIIREGDVAICISLCALPTFVRVGHFSPLKLTLSY
jgi:hypothetical protein